MSDAADPIQSLAAVFASIGARTQDYVSVWKTAIDRNGNEDYAAADLLGDLEALWSMSIGDLARFGAAFVDAAGPLFAGFVDPSEDPPSAAGDPADGSG